MSTSMQLLTGQPQRTQPTYRIRRLILRLLGLFALLAWTFLCSQLFV